MNEDGFHHSGLLLLVPSLGHDSVFLHLEGKEGPAGNPVGGNELSLLLDGFWMALLVARNFHLHRLDCGQEDIGIQR